MKLESICNSQFDKVLSLDSAYHYHSRFSFLKVCNKEMEYIMNGKQSFQILKPGGKVALSDIVIKKKDNSIANKVLQSLFTLADAPKENLITSKEYEHQLESIGFQNIKIEIITENVWRGFVLFLEAHKKRFERLIANELWMQYQISAKFLSWISQGKCDYILITAKKPIEKQ